MRKLFLVTSILLIATLVLTACAPAEPPPAEPAAPVEEPTEVTDAPEVETSEKTILPEMTEVSILTDWYYSTDYAALMSADYHGYFTERNLDVELRPGGPGIRAANDLITGKVDFGIALAENVILATAAGGEFTTFYATYQVSPMGLMVHEESGARSFEDIIEKDMTVRIFPGQVFWEVLKYENDIKLEEVMWDGTMTAWIHEGINWADQAFATTNPYHAMQEGANPVHISATQLGFRSYATTYFTNTQFVDENPMVVKAFAEALREGHEIFFEDPEPVVRHITELNEDFMFEVGMFATDVMRVLCVGEATEELGLGAMRGEVWSDVASRMYAAGIIDVEVDADELWTNDFLPPK